MNVNIISEFLKKLNKPDPHNVLMLTGISSASNWLKNLSLEDRKIIYNYMKDEIEKGSNLTIIDSIVKVLQNVGGQDSIILLDKIINEGEQKYSNYIISYAVNAKEKLKDYSVSEFKNDLNLLIEEIEQKINNCESGVELEENVGKLNEILDELNILKGKSLCKIEKRKKEKSLKIEYLINTTFKYTSPLRKKLDKLIYNYKYKL